MYNIIFRHQKEDITLMPKGKTNHGRNFKYRRFDDARKKLEKFSPKISSCKLFASWASAAKDTCKQFKRTNIAFVNKNGSLCFGFPRHKYIFSGCSKRCEKHRDSWDPSLGKKGDQNKLQFNTMTTKNTRFQLTLLYLSLLSFHWHFSYHSLIYTIIYLLKF